ncbi:hypothetical protein BV25DRAFT_243286 [Artomyces pyxidatus]|uniref:Uncharacterized protein n=1 Tax=Artomyces pyxidatus TaxID=48021 RepID=A0ACB8T8A5_9AGAM|nr:hypothetical protein BV25DRAFT_243286 [Artomyces pyxidatus]
MLGLLKLKELRSLRLRHGFPLLIRDADAVRFSSSFPKFVELDLNSYPMFYQQPKLTLGSLLPFSKNCPTLRTLGLFVDTRRSDSLLDTLSSRFEALRTLNFGRSLVSTEASLHVTRLLSVMVPESNDFQLFPASPGNIILDLDKESSEYRNYKVDTSWAAVDSALRQLWIENALERASQSGSPSVIHSIRAVTNGDAWLPT